jgi:serine protease
VISISMGGLFSWRLREAVRYAKSQGVIICAAAGNYAPFVGWPGAYDEVIACAASNVRGGTWKWGCRGRAVDVTAPGESVWRATVRREGKNLVYDVGRGNGTSLATTTTAGVAALWLSHHGRDSLIARYGLANVADVFQRVLCETCVKFPGWQEGKFGAGLIDAVAALEAELPAASTARESSMRVAMESHPEIDSGRLATFHHLFDSRPLHDLVFALCALLQTSEADLDRVLRAVGQELAFHLATDVGLYHAFRDIAQPTVALESPAIESLRSQIISRASKKLRAELVNTSHLSAKKPPIHTQKKN